MPTWRNQMKAQSLGLVCSFLGKGKRNHLIQNVKWWELRWCWKIGVHEKMVPKCELHDNILVHVQKLNYEKDVYELKDHVGKEVMNLNLLPKLGHVKKFLL